MPDPVKAAVAKTKIIMRNGYDAYVINPNLQRALFANDGLMEVDIATDMGIDDLIRVFPSVTTSSDKEITGVLREDDAVYRFYKADLGEDYYADTGLSRLTPRMFERLKEHDEESLRMACFHVPGDVDLHDGFEDLEKGVVSLAGLPDETLSRNYLLGIRALRFAANYNLPLAENTRMAILRNAQDILDYVPVSHIMDEWRKVEAEAMYIFVRLLFDTMLLHGLAPEVAALSRVKQVFEDDEKEYNILDLTLETMRRYPEELPYDWKGTLACMFVDVGKLYTADHGEDGWSFYQHYRIGAKVTRRILNRWRFLPEDVDLVCHLVRHSIRFRFMLTDRGIRRFHALEEYPRLTEISRAIIKARDTTYTEFNHNLKQMERVDTPEEMLEPLLNGNEIMEFTGVNPGPAVGIMREALLKAQIAGEVSSIPDAVEFVQRYRDKERLS